MSTTLMFTGRKRLRTKERLLRDPLLGLMVLHAGAIAACVRRMEEGV